MTATLTDRYIWAVQNSLPENQRAEIDRELRATIADTIDAKLAAGSDPATAEREVILELGDPYRLAAGYADRPLQLIGPKLFPDYIRLLKVLYAIVLPVAAAGILLGQLLSQPENIGEAIGSSVGVVISVAVHIGFWTTLVFAVIERSPETTWSSWDPDTLPQLPVGNTINVSDTLASIVWMVIILGGIVWGQVWPMFRDAAGAVIPLFDQSLWSFWLPYLLAVTVLELVFHVVLYRRGKWSWPLAIINLVLGAAFIIPLLWLLLTEQLINPAFLAVAEIAPLFAADGVVTIVLAVVMIAAGLASAVTGFVRASRVGRRVPSARGWRTTLRRYRPERPRRR